MHMASGQMPSCCKWVHLHLELCLKEFQKEVLKEEDAAALKGVQLLLLCLPWRCCHGAMQHWASPLCSPQLPLGGGMEDVHQGSDHGWGTGAHKLIPLPLTQSLPSVPAALFPAHAASQTSPPLRSPMALCTGAESPEVG